ncbi:hypothetical protein CL653_01820 [bacterium]|nr:hypothetical protein [bacterium]
MIKNKEELATNNERQDALLIAEAGLSAVDTEETIRQNVRIDKGRLEIHGHHFILSDYQNVYIIGFGKVVCTAAKVLEDILADNLTDGAVVGLEEKVCAVVDTYAGTHPRPSHINYTATKHIAEVAKKAGEKDLVLVIVSGGGSSLLCSSMSECEQGQRLYTDFLSSGGTIEELNILRKHISNLKGGGLAKLLYPATVVGLIFSDIPGGDCSVVASGPTYFDSSTSEKAESILTKYDLKDYHLQETPKEDKWFTKVVNVELVSNNTALNAMKDKALLLGYKAKVLASDLYNTPEETIEFLGDKRDVGTVYLMGGETTLTIPKDCIGKGGRNDFLAMCMLDHLEPWQTFVALASDGHDNTESAGAIADIHILDKAKELNLDVEDYKECLNSWPFYDQVGGHIETGHLESNVSDLFFLLNKKHE